MSSKLEGDTCHGEKYSWAWQLGSTGGRGSLVIFHAWFSEVSLPRWQLSRAAGSGGASHGESQVRRVPRKGGSVHDTLSCAGKDYPLRVRTEWVPPSCVWYRSKHLPLLMACQIHEGKICFAVFFPLNIVAPAPVHCLAYDGCPINT